MAQDPKGVPTRRITLLGEADEELTDAVKAVRGEVKSLTWDMLEDLSKEDRGYLDRMAREWEVLLVANPEFAAPPPPALLREVQRVLGKRELPTVVWAGQSFREAWQSAGLTATRSFDSGDAPKGAVSAVDELAASSPAPVAPPAWKRLLGLR